MFTPVEISTVRRSRSLLPSRRCISPPLSLRDVDELQPFEPAPQEARSDLMEPLGGIGHEKVVLAAARPCRQESFLPQALAYRCSGGFRRVDQRHLGADRPPDHLLEQRVVRAPEDEG